MVAGLASRPSFARKSAHLASWCTRTGKDGRDRVGVSWNWLCTKKGWAPSRRDGGSLSRFPWLSVLRNPGRSKEKKAEETHKNARKTGEKGKGARGKAAHHHQESPSQSTVRRTQPALYTPGSQTGMRYAVLGCKEEHAIGHCGYVYWGPIAASGHGPLFYSAGY